MAYTYPYRGVRVKAEDSFLSQLIRQELETDSSTFVSGAPVVLTSGLITEGPSPVVATSEIVGFARRAGQNGTSKLAEYILAIPGLLFFANFLNDTNPQNTTNAIAAADKGAAHQMQKDTNISGDGGKAIWHVADNQTTPACYMVSFESDVVAPNISTNNPRAVVADLNARVLFTLMNAAIAYTA